MKKFKIVLLLPNGTKEEIKMFATCAMYAAKGVMDLRQCPEQNIVSVAPCR